MSESKTICFTAMLFALALLGSCSKNAQSAEDNDIADLIVGKSFRCEGVSISEGTSAGEDTKTISFISPYICTFSNYGWEVNIYNGKEHWSFEYTLEYTMQNGEIFLEQNEDGYYTDRFSYDNGRLVSTFTGEVYEFVENIGINNRYDPPQGERTYIPTGWYESGAFEGYIKRQADGAVSAGDFGYLQSLSNDNVFSGISGIRVVDDNTFETAAPGVTSKNPPGGYYATQRYTVGTRSITFYFYYAYCFQQYRYRIVDGDLYLRGDDYIWKKEGACTVSRDKLQGVIFDECSRVNFNGDYAW